MIDFENNMPAKESLKKVYVIFSASITALGGGQIYIRAKVNYLKRMGYIPIVFSYYYGKCYIDDLKEFESNIISELHFPVSAYSPKKRTQIIEKIISHFPSQIDSMIIESHELETATWAELIAQNFNARHIVYLLSEDPWKMPPDFASFFLGKYNRHELFFISPIVATLFFQKYLNISEEKPENYTLQARYGSTIENVPEDKFGIKYDKDSFTICSIGRLEKNFVYPMCLDLLDFFNKYPERKFTLIFAGGSRFQRNEMQIRQVFSKAKNCSLFITGFVFPIPESILQKSDVCISSAGSAKLSARCGIPTVSIDAIDYKPIGILDFTTENATIRNKEPIRDLGEWLNDILFEKKYTKNFVPQKKSLPDFSDHLDAVKNIEKIYFDTSLISSPRNLSIKAKILSTLKCPKLIYKIRSMFVKVK